MCEYRTTFERLREMFRETKDTQSSLFGRLYHLLRGRIRNMIVKIRNNRHSVDVSPHLISGTTRNTSYASMGVPGYIPATVRNLFFPPSHSMLSFSFFWKILVMVR